MYRSTDHYNAFIFSLVLLDPSAFICNIFLLLTGATARCFSATSINNRAAGNSMIWFFLDLKWNINFFVKCKQIAQQQEMLASNCLKIVQRTEEINMNLLLESHSSLLLVLWCFFFNKVAEHLIACWTLQKLTSDEKVFGLTALNHVLVFSSCTSNIVLCYSGRTLVAISPSVQHSIPRIFNQNNTLKTSIFYWFQKKATFCDETST